MSNLTVHNKKATIFATVFLVAEAFRALLIIAAVIITVWLGFKGVEIMALQETQIHTQRMESDALKAQVAILEKQLAEEQAKGVIGKAQDNVEGFGSSIAAWWESL